MKKPKQVTEKTPAQVSNEGFTTFSIRLNEQQRDRLLEAAAIKGWTPTQLVRIAALERAVAICNTALPRTFDYKGFAAELAGQWFAPRVVHYQLTDADWHYITDPDFEGGRILEVPVSPLPVDVAFKLKKAAAEAGTEFLNLLMDFTEGLTASQRTDLPAPIDPKKLIEGED